MPLILAVLLILLAAAIVYRMTNHIPQLPQAAGYGSEAPETSFCLRLRPGFDWDLRKKRLIERLISSKPLIYKDNLYRNAGAAATTEGATWLTCEARIYLTDFCASQ